MNISYGIVILLIICSVLSAIELDCIKEKKNLFWKISFYFSAYWFIASFVKYYLGYHKENLIESFWDMQFLTIIHYGIPLAVIAVAAPIVLKLLFGETVTEVIRYFDSTLFFTLSFTFFFVRKINNKTYCAAFLLAIIITLAAIALKKYGGGIYQQAGYQKGPCGNNANFIVIFSNNCDIFAK